MIVNRWLIRSMGIFAVALTSLNGVSSAIAGDELPGACCFQGNCSEIPQSFCVATGGTFLGEETLCEDNLGACEIGACCLPGGCVELQQVDCGAMNGEAFAPGATCGEGSCGACCLPEGDCFVTDQAGCANTDGAIYNADEICVGEVCGPAPTGACCTESGCLDNQSDVDCGNAGGIWAGPNSDCITEPTICDVGECCLGTTCVNDIEVNCLNQGGAFTAGALCSAGSCPEPIGACCAESACVETTEAICLMGQDREWLGEGTTCEPDCTPPPDPTGACCLPESGCVDGFTNADCSSNGGQYLGDNSSCAGSSGCDFGACCRGMVCTEDFGFNCATVGGDFLGAGTTCTPDPCGGGPVTGACCQISGICNDAVLDTDCQNLGGTFLGPGSMCTPDACDTGACCSPSAGCQQITENDCLALGDAVYFADANCGQNPCAPGACCAGSDGMTCVPNIDPWNCTEANGRTFVGAGTTCNPNPCFVPTCETCPGDTNGDGLRNGADMQSMVDCLIAANGGAPTMGCECADMNDDDTLDTTDINLVVDAFLLSTGPCP